MDALATSDVALIDEELAEHQRWGAALEQVGAAGSATRANFVAQQADAGTLGGGAQALVTGLGMGAATRALEIAGERGAVRLAGQALGRTAPIPAIGAVIGGVMSAMDLAERDWGQTGQTIGRLGEGASDYDWLANSIAAVSEIISVYTSVLNVIAGVVGAISIAMWIITVVTLGVASPLAATLSTIAAAIGIATMILDGINAMALQPLITTFRALHAFKSQADPTEVEEQGAQVRQAAAAGAGFVGGFAGGLAGSHGASAAGRRAGLVPPHTAPTPHETPPPAAGEGTTIHADPPQHAPIEGEGMAPRQPGEPILPPAEPHAPMPEIPAPPRLPDIEAPPPGTPVEPGTHPVNPEGPTMPAPADPNVDPYRPTEPAPPLPELQLHAVLEGGPEASRGPAPDEFRMTDDQATAPPAASAAAEIAPAPREGAATPREGGAPPNEPTQLSFGPEITEPPPRTARRLSPNEVAPPNARSAYLRALRAQAAGEPRPPVDWGTNNIARHLLPDAAFDTPGGMRNSRTTASPTPDLYQPSPRPGPRRTPREHQSHHPELQSLLREAIADYNPNEDVTGLLRQQGHHDVISPAQRVQDTPRVARDATVAALGTPESLQAAHNLLVWGDVNGPTSPGARPLMDPAVAGQLVMEHASYMFETTRLSRGFEGPTPTRPGETPLSSRRSVDDVLRGRGETIDPFANIDWDRTFNQPDPYRAAQPPGTQFGLFGEHTPPPPAPSPQLSLSLPETAPRPVLDPRQGDLFAPRPSPSEGGGTHLMADTGATPPGAAPRPPTRSTQPLSAPERAQLLQMAAEMGYPPERVVFHDGPTSVRNGVLRIGPDVNPLPPEQRPTGLVNPANTAVAARGVLGHEIIGHIEAAAMGQRRPERWHEEFQASTRAALHTPELPPDQMRLLMADAAARLRGQTRPGTIFIDTSRPTGVEPPGPAQPRLPGQFRPQDQLPSVILDRTALGLAPPTGAALTARPAIQAPASPGSDRSSGGGTHGFGEPAPVRQAPTAPRTATTGIGGAFERLRHGYVGTLAGGLWSAVPGVEQVHRGGRLTSTWFGDERLRPPPSRRDAMGQPIGYSRNEQHAIAAGGLIGASSSPLGGGVISQRVGEGVIRRGLDLREGLIRGATEPIVERVNPDYPPPPEGGYGAINALQERLSGILEARASAEASAAAARHDAAHHQANMPSLNQFEEQTSRSISATQAHQAATQRRQQANARRQASEADVSRSLADAAQRRSGLSTLTVPLRGFQRFSSLGESMPDGIDLYPTALVGPKAKIRQLNRDATDFLNALDGVDATICQQRDATGSRHQEVIQHNARLTATGTGATTSMTSLERTRQQGEQLAQRNQQRADESARLAQAAAAEGTQLDGEAQQTRTAMQSSAQRWQAWATAHRAARQAAIERRRRALEERGYRVRKVTGAQ